MCVCVFHMTIIVFTLQYITFCHLADVFIQRDLQASQDNQASEDSNSKRAVVQILK